MSTEEDYEKVAQAANEIAEVAVKDGLFPLLREAEFTEDMARGFIAGLEVGVACGHLPPMIRFWLEQTLEVWHRTDHDHEDDDAPAEATAGYIVSAMLNAARASNETDVQREAKGIAIAHLMPRKERSDA